MKLVHVVADYGPGDLAFAEIVSALARHLPDDARWHCTPIESFDTVSTGFVVAQLALSDESVRPPEGLFIYANCAPRADRSSARRRNEGEGLLYAELINGVKMLVVNSGLSLSWVRDEMKSLRAVEVDSGGSQFRSRDVFPPTVGKLVRGQIDFLGDVLDPQRVIPEPPSGLIGYVDSFGNLKTTFREGQTEVDSLKEGERLSVRINGIQRTVTVATGSFNVREGDIAFAPGSSGHGRRFWEIFQRGGNAWQTYGSPRAGAPVELPDVSAT